MSDHYTESMYRAKGLEVKLEYLGPLPARVTDKTHWKCLVCGKLHFKTYRALCLRPNGCRCQSPTTLDKSKYIAAAAAQNIAWTPIDGLMPPNSKTRTAWTGPSGEVVMATYHEIAYKMPVRIKKALGLNVKEPSEDAFRPQRRKGRKPSELRGLPPQAKGRRRVVVEVEHDDARWQAENEALMEHARSKDVPKEKKRRKRNATS
jgi:hypothetical protein